MHAKRTISGVAVAAVLGAGALTPAMAQKADQPTSAGIANHRAATGAAPSVVPGARAGDLQVTWSGRGRHWVYASTEPGNPARTGHLVGTSNDGRLTLTGLSTAKRWYVEVTPDRSGKRGAVASTVHLALDSTTNTRDLGGLRTASGGSVRWGRLFRTDAVTAPTARDASVLAGLGLTRSLDFRSPAEIAGKGPNRYPADVAQTLAPLLDPSTDALSQAIQAVLGGGDPGAVEELLGGGEAMRIALTGPAQVVETEQVQQAFGAALRDLSREGTVIFNCTAGKDRTGVFAAVVLRILGVSESDITDDYVLSNVYRARYNEQTYQTLARAGVDVSLIKPLLEQQPGAMRTMFETIDREYGSFEEYVRDELGLDRRTVERLRATLVLP